MYKDSLTLPEVSTRPPQPKVSAIVEATKKKCRIIDDVPLFPDGYDYLSTFENITLPDDFFRERLEAVPF